MGGHEGRARPEAAMDFAGRPPPFIGIEEMQREQAGRGIEGSIRRVVDKTLVKLHAFAERP